MAAKTEKEWKNTPANSNLVPASELHRDCYSGFVLNNNCVVVFKHFYVTVPVSGFQNDR